MLAVSPLTNSYKDGREGERGGGDELFLDFSGDNLLDSINFDDLFDGDVLPDLEMDPELLAEFSLSGGEDSNGYTSASFERTDENSDDKVSGSASSLLNQGDEIVSKRDDKQVPVVNLTPKEPRDKGKKSSSQSKNHQAKRKVKVDWTPELHRRFVQAVEQLGVDKAVPSRILELMGIDCLTRHNIASHLQKYRSHRKHMLAREAEAANWSQKRQIYSVGGCGAGGGVGGGTKKEMNNSPWLPIAPTMCYPPMASMPHHFRPLHVWGHPPLDQSLAHVWSKHIAPSPHPPHIWPPPSPSHPPVPPRDPSYWHAHQRHVPNSVTAGTPYYLPPAIAPTRFPAPPVPGIPHHAMYKLDPSIGVPTTPTYPKPPLDFHPSKESVDEIIGDVLSKPWLPLPIGLNPPSLDSVMVELNHQGIQKVPPTCG